MLCVYRHAIRSMRALCIESKSAHLNDGCAFQRAFTFLMPEYNETFKLNLNTQKYINCVAVEKERHKYTPSPRIW